MPTSGEGPCSQQLSDSLSQEASGKPHTLPLCIFLLGRARRCRSWRGWGEGGSVESPPFLLQGPVSGLGCAADTEHRVLSVSVFWEVPLLWSAALSPEWPRRSEHPPATGWGSLLRGQAAQGIQSTDMFPRVMASLQAQPGCLQWDPCPPAGRAKEVGRGSALLMGLLALCLAGGAGSWCPGRQGQAVHVGCEAGAEPGQF